MIQQFYFFGIYPKKMKTVTRKNTCTTMCIAALFTVVKTWQQTKCLSTDEWIKKMWYLNTIQYYSAIEKKWYIAICDNMAGSRG